MGDISREPLPGGARSKGTALKGPAEVIRLDDLTVEERADMDETRSGDEGPDDPAARAFPSPRQAPAAPMRIEPFRPTLDRLEEVDRLGEGGDRPADTPLDAAESVAEAAPAAAAAAAEEQPSAEVPGEDAVDEGVLSDTAALAVVADDPGAPEADFSEESGAMAAESAAAGDHPTIAQEFAVDEEETLVSGLGSDEAEVAVDGAGADGDAVEMCAVPTVDELVEDGEAPAAQAEPLRASSLPEDGDEAPPLTDPEEVGRVLLAVLLSAREPLSLVRMAEVCNSTQKVVEAGLRVLDAELRQRGLPLEIVQMGDGVRVSTSPAVYPYLTRLKKLKPAEKLSPAALETLAVIAYRQPVIRLEVEAIRGVKVGPMLQSLLQHKLIRVVGRADVPGKPLQYGTTQHFLERFGLRSLKDLPSIQEFRALG